MDHPTLTGTRVTLRPLRPGDESALRAILAEPSVARWWGPAGVDGALEELFGQHGHVTLVIDVDGVIAGSMMYAEEEDPDYRHVGVDLFLGAAHQGRGLGRDALRTLARFLFEVRGHHRLTIDPAADNAQAIRAYRAVGFRPVGIMRAYERGPDGTWHDGLLLDLLAGELVGGEREGSGG